jgi:hypothetical protein
MQSPHLYTTIYGTQILLSKFSFPNILAEYV